MPLTLQVEKAGGFSSCDGLCVSGLDVEIKKHDQRTQICYGSQAEVLRFEEYMYGNSPRFAEVRLLPHVNKYFLRGMCGVVLWLAGHDAAS